jgi:hypothetical protein
MFQLAHSEQNQNELQATRLALEKEITVKKNSIIIDRERCLRSDNIKQVTCIMVSQCHR